MEAHYNIVKELNEEFKKVDKQYTTNELRVFGRDTPSLFKELDEIRAKQINLAIDHVSLESHNDILPSHISKLDLKENNEILTKRQFEKKEVMLMSMMEKTI
ncbi:hypothetical protein BDB01DRAFT_785523 [Pilobolus umbonatus]|nr:hypothetical protein BDB01DRAFT_785523 [Pilobolus umbonatus]